MTTTTSTGTTSTGTTSTGTTSTGTTSSGTGTGTITGTSNRSAAATLVSVTFDCADALVVGSFWSAVLDLPLAEGASRDYALILAAPAWSFMSVPEPKSAKNRVHVDLGTEDLPAAVERIVALGATRLGDFDEAGYRWATLADPEGNEFDVVVPSEGTGHH